MIFDVHGDWGSVWYHYSIIIPARRRRHRRRIFRRTLEEGTWFNVEISAVCPCAPWDVSCVRSEFYPSTGTDLTLIRLPRCIIWSAEWMLWIAVKVQMFKFSLHLSSCFLLVSDCASSRREWCVVMDAELDWSRCRSTRTLASNQQANQSRLHRVGSYLDTYDVMRSHEVSLLVNMSCMWAMLQIRRFRRFLRCPGKGNSRRCTISQRWIGGQKSGTSVTIVSSSLGISRSAGVRRQTFEHEVNSANWCLVLAVRHKNWSDNSIRSFFLSPQSSTTPGQRNPTCIHCLLEETTTLLLRSWMCKYQVIVLKRTWFLLHQIAYIFTASYSLRCCQVKTSPF